MNLIDLRSAFEAAANPAHAQQMEAYMKGRFRFHGLKAPLRRTVHASFMKEALRNRLLDKDLVQSLWAQEEREYQMTALDYLPRTKRSWMPEDLDFFKELIQNKSWWDSVDALAATMVGGVVQKYPVLHSVMEEWNKSEDMWLVRTSIIYQLKYKEHMDVDQLERFILAHADSKEFFINKAAGWALRQCAKFHPERVKTFVDQSALSSLTVREASKHLI